MEWVQKEFEILERAGVIQRSMSPWASPIVIVPKKSEPGEPPRRRMCVDYRMLNSLLPPVNKAHSKAKGIVMQGLSILFARVGSGDPVRVLRLYTTNTLDVF